MRRSPTDTIVWFNRASIVRGTSLIGGCRKSPECDWLGKKSAQDLMIEYADETVDKLKAKAKFANLCDCDVTTTTVLTAKVLKYAVEEVEKDLQISLYP